MRFVIQPLTIPESNQFYRNKFLTKFNEEYTVGCGNLLIWNMSSVREGVEGITPETIEIFLDFCAILSGEHTYNFFLGCIQEYDYHFGKYIEDGEFVKDLERCIEDEPDERVSELITRVREL